MKNFNSKGLKKYRQSVSFVDDTRSPRVKVSVKILQKKLSVQLMHLSKLKKNAYLSFTLGKAPPPRVMPMLHLTLQLHFVVRLYSSVAIMVTPFRYALQFS